MVTRFALTAGPNYDHSGSDVSSSLDIYPSVRMIQESDGTVYTLQPIHVDIAAGESVTVQLPHTNQPGMIDTASRVLTEWFYTVHGVDKGEGESKYGYSYKKIVSGPVGTTSIDLDLIPEDGDAPNIPEGTPVTIALPGQVIKGDKGDPGPQGDPGPASTVPGPPGDPGPQGEPGPASTVPGPANSLTIGAVTTSAPGAEAEASIHGTPPAQILDLTLPRGDAGSTGAANSLAIGTVTTGVAGSSASATITGTPPSQTLNMAIPRGDTGAAGSNGSNGTNGNTYAGIDDQTGTAYTLVLADANKLVRCNNASAITVTIPPNSSVAFPLGTVIDILTVGVGKVTVAAGSGVTVVSSSTLVARAQWSILTVIKDAADHWVLAGDNA